MLDFEKRFLVSCFTVLPLIKDVCARVLSLVFLLKEGDREMRLSGKVKWFDNKLGYGFIKQDSGEEIFVHYSKIRGDGYKTLKEGQKVEFEIIQSPEGRSQAGDVEVVPASAAS
jgi:CspA family cold shock protein